MTRAKEFAECVGLDSSCPLPIAFLCCRTDAQNTSQTFLPEGDKLWSPPQSVSFPPHAVKLVFLAQWLWASGRIFILNFHYWRNFDKLAFRLDYRVGIRDLWGCNYWVWLHHWGMEQKTGLWQRERRALRHTIPQKVQCSFLPPQKAAWQWAMVGASPGGERRCWRMCHYLFPQVFPPWQSCTRTTDLAVITQSCLPLQLSRDLPWHFAQLWAPGAVVGRRALPKKSWVYCAVLWSAMQRSPSDPLPNWEMGIIHPSLTSPN